MKHQELIHSMAKVELHCHLLGIIGPNVLNQIRQLGREMLVDIDALKKIYPISGLDGFRSWLALTLPYQSAPVSFLIDVLSIYIQDLIKQNVVYAEIMLSPLPFMNSQKSLIKTFKGFRDQVLLLEQGKVQIEFIVVLPRSLPEEKIKSDVENILGLYKEGLVVGVAIVGLEDGLSLEKFKPYLHVLKKAGLKVEIHVGEHSDAYSVQDVIASDIADRIGHGIGAFKDSQVLEELKASKIHLEFCISSNLSTGSVLEISEHPIQKANQLDMNFSVNTDDPGIFDCSMTGEFLILHEKLGFTIEDFNKIFKQSLAARFADTLRYMK